MLIELPNGNWIDPRYVSGVQFWEEDGHLSASILVETTRSGDYVIPVESNEVGRRLVRELAASINASLNEAPGGASDE